MTTEDQHRSMLERRIRDLYSGGVIDYHDVLRAIGGADPREVYALWCTQRQHKSRQRDTPQWSTPGVGGSLLPIEDPAKGQWWFTPSSIEWIVGYVEGLLPLVGDEPANAIDILALGTPTLAMALGRSLRRVCCLDVDEDVVASVKRRAPSATARVYDVANALPSDLQSSASVVVLDPPWYQPTMQSFVYRALQACRRSGHLIMTLPSQCTRPGVETEKQELMRGLAAAGLQVRLYHRDHIEFTVPVFERRAFQDIAEFRATPWRRADILHLAVESNGWESHIGAPTYAIDSTNTHARDPRYFRVFHSNDPGPGTPPGPRSTAFTPYGAYRREVSQRKVKTSTGEYNVWTSERRAGRAGDLEALEIVLREWEREDVSTDSSRLGAIEALIERGDARAAAESFVRALDDELELWTRFHHLPLHRNDDEIVTKKEAATSHLATKQAAREAESIAPAHREHSDPSDTFRAEYQRDRDRVLWSGGLRQLANKTQLFPAAGSDQLRQRLAHSLEVMQLSTTVADAFGLNRDLVEAGALAHDIGHTPFGHAGEHALDELLHDQNTNLGGFNHYEHGVDVVRYLEDPYQSLLASGYLGLNLTSAVCECILKHAFCHVDAKWKEDRESIWRSTKHRDFILPGNPHLEGQAVRIADKVSYLVSDLEDGILLGAIQRDDLFACRLFHYAPIDFREKLGGDLHAEFLVQRRNLIQVLMEDLIVASESRIARLENAAAVRNCEHFVIDHSDEMRVAVNEVWERVQRARLHQDARVIMANMRAARIVKELTVLFAIFPNLVEPRFESAYRRVRSSDYMAWYRRRVGRKTAITNGYADFLPLHWLIDLEPGRAKEFDVELLVQAKDYVAGLTDNEAKRLHHRFITSYSDRG